MSELTRDEIIAVMRGDSTISGVHVSNQNTVTAAQPNHIYFLPGRPSNAAMAAMTSSTSPGNLEIALMRINGHHFISVGSPNDAVVTFPFYGRNGAITDYAFLAITHPSDHPSFRRRSGNSQPTFHAPPTSADHLALARFEREWSGQNTYVIVCHGGRVSSTIPFREPVRSFEPEEMSNDDEERFHEMRRQAREERERTNARSRRSNRTRVERDRRSQD